LLDIEIECGKRRLCGGFAQAERLPLRLQPDLKPHGLLKLVAHE
jgi:hypothetical protein